MKFLIFGLLFAAASIQFSESLSISTSYYESDPKDELVKQAENLKKLAQDEIAKLKAQGKTLLAGGLEQAEKFILDLETQLKNLNPTSALGKALLGSLEALLKKAEETLEAEIKKLSGSFYADDVKAELLKQAENLKKLAQDEIEKLKSQGKTLLAGGLEQAEKFILDLETQLKNLNPTSALGKALLGSLEALLKKAEETLEAEIKKLSGSLYTDDVKAELLKQTTNFKTDKVEDLDITDPEVQALTLKFFDYHNTGNNSFKVIKTTKSTETEVIFNLKEEFFNIKVEFYNSFECREQDKNDTLVEKTEKGCRTTKVCTARILIKIAGSADILKEPSYKTLRIGESVECSIKIISSRRT